MVFLLALLFGCGPSDASADSETGNALVIRLRPLAPKKPERFSKHLSGFLSHRSGIVEAASRQTMPYDAERAATVAREWLRNEFDLESKKINIRFAEPSESSITSSTGSEVGYFKVEGTQMFDGREIIGHEISVTVWGEGLISGDVEVGTVHVLERGSISVTESEALRILAGRVSGDLREKVRDLVDLELCYVFDRNLTTNRFGDDDSDMVLAWYWKALRIGVKATDGEVVGR